MRISDWSSDVCSSDLALLVGVHCALPRGATCAHEKNHLDRQGNAGDVESAGNGRTRTRLHHAPHACGSAVPGRLARSERPQDRLVLRSEEHTSELQSLMRISYAVFCLNKKTKN